MPAVKRSAKTVSIACKLPQGLHIHLDGRREPIKLHGQNSPFNIAGHGITQGVSVDDWAAIQAQYKESPWLKNGFVFANGDGDDLAEEADDRKDVQTGFEPIDPRKPDARSGSLAAIQPDGAQDPGERA
jgi:hypothetical protein